MNMSFQITYSLSSQHLQYYCYMPAGKIATLHAGLDAFGLIFKCFSGLLSDYIKRRRMLIILGVIFSLIAHIGFVYTPVMALFLQRTGRGLYIGSRDSLIGDLIKKNVQYAYGIKDAIACFGGFLGTVIPLLCTVSLVQAKCIFWICIPVIVSLLLSRYIKDPITEQSKKRVHPNKEELLKLVKKNKSTILSIIALSIFRFPEGIFIVRAFNEGQLCCAHAPVVLLTIIISRSIFAHFFGLLSIYICQKNNLLVMLAVSAVSLFISGWCSGLLSVITAAIFWGAFLANMDQTFQSRLAKNVPIEFRGSMISIYFLSCFLGTLFTSFLLSVITPYISLSAIFVICSCIIGTFMIGLIVEKMLIKIRYNMF